MAYPAAPQQYAAPLLTPRVITPVSIEFQRMATELLRELQVTAEPEVQPLIASTLWHLQFQPSVAQLNLLRPPPEPDQVLLGLFTAPPPTITIFENNIRLVASKEGQELRERVRDVIIHELQHRFGLNHTADRAAAWLSPGFDVPGGG